MSSIPACVCARGVCFVCVFQVLSVHVCVHMCEWARIEAFVYACAVLHMHVSVHACVAVRVCECMRLYPRVGG